MNYGAHSILCLALVSLVFLGCSDTITAPSSSEDTVFPASSSSAKKEVPDITVSPSGDLSGVTDADAIENALNAAAPGAVIELREGTFYINRTLVAPGFNGTLRGEDDDETTIVGVGTESAPFGNTLINFPDGPFLLEGSAFFFFPQPSGNLIVSDLSTSLPGGFVTEVSDFFEGGTDLIAFFIVQLGDDDCNTLFDNVRLEGTEVSTPDAPPFLVHQPLFGIEVLGVGDAFPSVSSGGYHVVRNSEFSKVGFDTTVHQLLKDASIEITNNTFTDIKQIIARYLDGTDVSITRNTMDTFLLGAIVVTQEGFDIPGERSNVLIGGNNINTRGFIGIEVGSHSSPVIKPDFNLLIEKNTITKGADPLGFLPNLAGIQIATGEEGAMVRNNMVRGDGDFGVLADHVNDSVFMGNNLQGFTHFVADYGLIDSDDNTIVGRGNATVLDLGSGNIITGLTKVPGDRSIGERIKAAQQRRKEILDALGRGYY